MNPNPGIGSSAGRKSATPLNQEKQKALHELEVTKANFNHLIYEINRLNLELTYVKEEKYNVVLEENIRLKMEMVQVLKELNDFRRAVLKSNIDELNNKSPLRVAG